MKKNRKIWYTGCFSKQECNIHFTTYMKIWGINTHQFLTRQWRRMVRLLGYCKYSMALVPLWAIYVCIVSLIGSKFSPPYSISTCIWDVRTGFFTSIVIASATSVIAGMRKDKNIYQRQHTIYTDIMAAGSNLIKELTAYVVGNIEREHVSFWPLYDINSLSDFHTVFSQKNHVPSQKQSQRVHILIERFRKSIDRLLAAQNTNSIADCNWTKLQEAVSTVCYWCDAIEDAITENDSNAAFHSSKSFVMDLYSIMEMLRYPWRRDLSARIKILELIIADDPAFEMNMSYYDRSILNREDYELYRLMATMTLEDFTEYVRDHFASSDT